MDEDLTDSGADTFDPIYTPELETLTTPPQDSDIPVIDQFGAVDTTPEADPIYTPELETLTTPPEDSGIPVIDDFGAVDTTPETRVGLEQSGTVEPILEQGVFDTSFQGTCGICTVANVLNTIVGEGRYSEGSVLEPAIREGLCTVDSIPENNGGTSVDDRAALYELMEPDAVNVDVHEGSTALTPAEIAKELERGNAVEIFVSSDELWDTKSLPGRMFDFGLGRPPKYDHAIQVVAPVTNDIGEITSWTVADSGGGVQQVSARKFDLMYWGRKSTPPDNCASIVVSRK